MATTTEQQNMELMQTLDDAWNSEDQDVFVKCHKPDVVVRWPGKPPTHGIEITCRSRSSSGRPSTTSASTTGHTMECSTSTRTQASARGSPSRSRWSEAATCHRAFRRLFLTRARA